MTLNSIKILIWMLPSSLSTLEQNRPKDRSKFIISLNMWIKTLRISMIQRTKRKELSLIRKKERSCRIIRLEDRAIKNTISQTQLLIWNSFLTSLSYSSKFCNHQQKTLGDWWNIRVIAVFSITMTILSMMWALLGEFLLQLETNNSHSKQKKSYILNCKFSLLTEPCLLLLKGSRSKSEEFLLTGSLKLIFSRFNRMRKVKRNMLKERLPLYFPDCKSSTKLWS
jgi:hypothetical protein